MQERLDETTTVISVKTWSFVVTAQWKNKPAVESKISAFSIHVSVIRTEAQRGHGDFFLFRLSELFLFRHTRHVLSSIHPADCMRICSVKQDLMI